MTNLRTRKLAVALIAQCLTETDQVVCSSKESCPILVGDDWVSHLHNQVSITENIA